MALNLAAFRRNCLAHLCGGGQVIFHHNGQLSVSAAFAIAIDAEILKKAGITNFDDPRYQRYSDRLKKLRAIKDYQYVVHVLERNMSYEEVTESSCA
jgi:hypothetical protein